jgi:hypothetical protein
VKTTGLKGIVLRTAEVQTLAATGRVVVEREVKPAPDPYYPGFYLIETMFSFGMFGKAGEHKGTGFGQFYPECGMFQLYGAENLRANRGTACQFGEHHEEWRCPLGAPGERRAVRETYDTVMDPGCPDEDVKRTVWNEEEGETDYWTVDYLADGNHHRIMDKIGRRKWKPASTMPLWAVRFTVVVESVEVATEPWRWRVVLVKEKAV